MNKNTFYPQQWSSLVTIITEISLKTQLIKILEIY